MDSIEPLFAPILARERGPLSGKRKAASRGRTTSAVVTWCYAPQKRQPVIQCTASFLRLNNVRLLLTSVRVSACASETCSHQLTGQCTPFDHRELPDFPRRYAFNGRLTARPSPGCEAAGTQKFSRKLGSGKITESDSECCAFSHISAVKF